MAEDTNNRTSSGNGSISIGSGSNITFYSPNGGMKRKPSSESQDEFDILDSDNTSANPTLEGTEPDLNSLLLNGTKYKVPSGGGGGGGSEITMNPTHSSSDVSISGMTVDGVKYQVDTIWYTTSTPTEANPNGVKLAILPEEPATKYDGYLYIIIPEYTVTYNISNGTHTGAAKIKEGNRLIFSITANSGYALPDTISVTGADYVYNSTTGVVVLTNPTGPVTVTAVCESTVTSYTVTVNCVNAGGYDSTYMTVYDYDASDLEAMITLYDGDSADVTVTSGQITLANGDGGTQGAAGTESVTGGLTYVSGDVWNPTYSVTGNGSITFAVDSCFAKGTQITLADGTTKNVEDITYNDELLVWNFYDGKLDKAKPVWIMTERVANRYKKVTLNDGTILRLVGDGEKCHRVYDVDEQKFRYANECVGHKVYKQDGNIATIVSCEVIEEQVKYYNLTTEKYLDCFAEGVLTGSRLNNMYHISEGMKYDSDERLISEEEEAERWVARRRIQKSR